MKETVQLLLALINSDLFARPLPEAYKQPLHEDALERLYQLASKHDLAHVVADALYKNKLLPKESAVAGKLQQAQVMALYRYTKLEHERKQIYRVFEDNGIAFVPLKGIIIRPLYPQPHLRTSCDIDILVHREDLERAISALKKRLSYSLPKEAETFHDVSLFSESGVHLELHFTIENDQAYIDRLLSQVWKHCSPVAEGSFEYRQSNEFFMFHQIAHMVSHFLNGGCGIRPLVDLALLQQKLPYDETAVSAMCNVCYIETFHTHVKMLRDVWFGDGEHTAVTAQMENFILYGGVYGNSDNSINVKRSRQKRCGAYLFSRIFMSYHLLKTQYPILKKYKWLYPVMTVHRWFRLLSPTKRHRATAELKKSRAITEEDQANMQNFLKELGLF